MNILALIIGLVVCYNPIWATFDASKCGKSQGCFIQPPSCNNGNDFSKCSVAASFKKLNDSWMEIELLTSRTRPFGDTPIGGNVSVYVAFGLSTDQNMGNDSVVDCVYNPSTSKVMGELSFNVPNVGNQPYDNGTNDPKLFNQAEWSVDDNMLYCRLQRIITPNPSDDQIYDASKSYFLFLVRGPANNDGSRYTVDKHILSKDDICNSPYISNASVLLTSPVMVDGISGYTNNAAPQDACKQIVGTTANPPAQTTEGAGGASTSVHATGLTTSVFTVISLALCLEFLNKKSF